MLLAEPPPSPYDLHFSIFGIPVRVHPMFWLVGAFLGFSSASLISVLIWMVALFVAILVHELGHALVMRHFGLRPRITLHGMGGLASYESQQLAYSRANTWIRQILIDVAGVVAGFLLALAIIVVFLALGHHLLVLAGINTSRVLIIGASSVATIDSPSPGYTGLILQIGDIKVVPLDKFVNALVRICTVWGLVNLLPVYPLDGGQISREIFLRFGSLSGIRNSLILSTITAGGLAAYFLSQVLRDAQLLKQAGESPGGAFSGASLFVPLFFGYLAYSSYATLQAYRDSRNRW